MTISSEVSRVSYTGNGAVDTYAYTFRIFEESHLLVTVRNTSDVETTLALTTDYTVTGVGNNSGNVVLVNSAQAWLDGDGDLLTGYVLSIRRVLPLTQETDIRNQGDFFPESHEDEFDKLTMVDQQQQDELDRSIKLPESLDPADVDTALPLPSAGLAIGWNATEDGLTNIASAGALAVSAFAETLLDDTTASAALTTLGVSTFAKTILDDTTASAVIATLGIVTAAELSSPDQVLNLGIAASVASNALTVSLKTQAGTDASSTSPITISFRNSTATTGTYVQRQVTSSLSMVVSSGSTLGHISAQSENVWVYAIDNAGTVELAVSGFRGFDENTLQSSTAEGGAGGADTRSTLYSTTARSNKAIRLIGRIKISESTAGTWASAPTEIATANNPDFVHNSTIYCQGANGYGSSGTTTFRWNSPNQNLGSDISITQSSTNGDSFTINTEGLYLVVAACNNTTVGTPTFGITLNSSSTSTDINSLSSSQVLSKTSASPSVGVDALMSVIVCQRLYPGDLIRSQSNGSTNTPATSQYSYFRITRLAD